MQRVEIPNGNGSTAQPHIVLAAEKIHGCGRVDIFHFDDQLVRAELRNGVAIGRDLIFLASPPPRAGFVHEIHTALKGYKLVALETHLPVNRVHQRNGSLPCLRMEIPLGHLPSERAAGIGAGAVKAD